MSNAPFSPSPLAQPSTITLPDGTVTTERRDRNRTPLPWQLNTSSNGGSSGRTLVGPGSTPATPSIAGTLHYAASTERLLPPSTATSVRYRDDESTLNGNPFSDSRRSSWSSNRVYSPDPFDDSATASRAPSISGSDEDVNTQTVSEKYNILPSDKLILYPENVEEDDYLHNPDLDDSGRCDCDVFNRRGMCNMFGMALMFLGILALFIVYPTVTFVMKWRDGMDPCTHFANCIDTSYTPSLIKNTRTTMIDPDTDHSFYTKLSADGKTKLDLVFSDEFNTPGRTFYEGDDPYFTAVDLWYGVTGDLEWYDPDAVTTVDGHLEIRLDAFQNHNLNYRSGMVQSWNKLCFTGGLLEASMSLPGRGDTVGLWPGFWSMGNLGRPGYAATTDGMWPYTYDNVCDAGITPNQSSTDGSNFLPGMRLPACTCSGEDHPNPGVARSSPEIDVIEATVAPLDDKGNMVGVVSQSTQLAPFDTWWYPDYDYIAVADQNVSTMNGYTGGVYQQAASVLSTVNNDWYDGQAYQSYGYEYDPGLQGSIDWFIGDQKTWTLDSRATRPNGNVAARPIPMEPMAMIMNLGLSNGFTTFINYTGLAPILPAKMRFDYVRIYQDKSKHTMTCDPPGYPTTDYIAQHEAPYQNVNLTQWSQPYGGFPKNALMHGCQSEASGIPITFPSAL